MMLSNRKVLLNYNGEVHIYYTHTSSDNKALQNARCRLEDELGKVRGTLKNYFKDKPNFEVRKEKNNEWKRWNCNKAN